MTTSFAVLADSTDLLVEAFARAGARVTVLDRPGAMPPSGHGWLGVDLSDLAGAQAKVTAAGPFDILINNAGAHFAHCPALHSLRI